MLQAIGGERHYEEVSTQNVMKRQYYLYIDQLQMARLKLFIKAFIKELRAVVAVIKLSMAAQVCITVHLCQLAVNQPAFSRGSVVQLYH